MQLHHVHGNLLIVGDFGESFVTRVMDDTDGARASGPATANESSIGT